MSIKITDARMDRIDKIAKEIARPILTEMLTMAPEEAHVYLAEVSAALGMTAAMLAAKFLKCNPDDFGQTFGAFVAGAIADMQAKDKEHTHANSHDAKTKSVWD